jgi:hypothetical protein
MSYNLQSKRLSKSNTIASRSDLKSMLMNDFKSHNYGMIWFRKKLSKK